MKIVKLKRKEKGNEKKKKIVKQGKKNKENNCFN
jgi:hypothetical protein